MIDVQKKEEEAIVLFKSGYNCSQAVVLAYADFIGESSELLATVTGPMGAGMGRLREVCGAVTGMFLVSGFLHKAYDPADQTMKVKSYSTVQELANEFTKENGSIVCRELLGLNNKIQSPIPEERTNDYYKKRPCVELVAIASRLVGEKINEKLDLSDSK